MTVNPDLCFGLPLMQARYGLVAPDLWRPALVASKARANPAWTDRTPPHSWRLEVFVPPLTAPPPQLWESWAAQQETPIFKAEAERQNTFYAVSLDLGDRLLSGELQGFGRKGEITGPWAPIPAEAWRVLRVAHSDDFLNWQMGHLVGGGAELWGVRIADMVGIPRHLAAVAYGPSAAAHIVQRSEAFGIVAVPSVARAPRDTNRANGNTLDARMAEWSQRQPMGLDPGAGVKREDYQRAQVELDRCLQQLIDSGALIADSPYPAGRAVLIRPALPSQAPTAGTWVRSSDAVPSAPAPSTTPRRTGRKAPRGTSYREQDRPLVEEMRRMLAAEPPRAKGAWDAALVVSKNAVGNGNGTSKTKRLLALYSATFRD
jgi:hypothetical protein